MLGMDLDFWKLAGSSNLADLDFATFGEAPPANKP
jgi:hypothetical protein